jgi:hypothetical protein
MHTRPRSRYGLAAVLLLLLAGSLAAAAPIPPTNRRADPLAKYISRAVEDRTNPLYAGPGQPTAQALLARQQRSLVGPLPIRNGKPVMRALVRFNDDAAIAKLRAMGCSVGAVVGNVATARIPVDKLAAVANLAEITHLRYAPRRQPLLDVSVPDVGGDRLHDLGYTGLGSAVGLVDTGIDWRSEDFIDEDFFYGTRILYLWDQTDPTGPPPPGFDYGTLYTKEDIDNALHDIGTVGEVDTIGHGTHVAGIAASNGHAPGNFVGMAPMSFLIVVKAPFDTDAGASDQELIDGNRFVADMAFQEDLPVAINNSWGGHFGEPHDGSSELETAMSDLGGEGVVLVAAAGNEGDLDIHAGATANRSRDYQWHFWMEPGFGTTEMAVDIWYPASTVLEVSAAYDFTPPEPPVPPLPPAPMPCATTQTEGVLTGDSNVFDITDGSWAGAQVSIDASDFSFDVNHTQVLVDMSAGGGFVPLGIVITVIEGDGTFDAWASGAQISPDDWPTLVGCMTDPLPGFFIAGDTRKTVGPPSTGDEIISVGSYNTKCSYLDYDGEEEDYCGSVPVGAASYFTSRGPRRDDVRKPDITAPGALIASTMARDPVTGQPLPIGLPDSYRTPDGEHVLYQGTSMAAPHVTGAIALLMEKNPWLTPDEVRNALLLSARTGSLFQSGWDPVWGWGKLDVAAAINLVPEWEERDAEVGIDFLGPVATLDLKYGIGEISWPREFSGITFDYDVSQPVPIPIDNSVFLQNHWALNDQIIRVMLRPEDIPVDPDGQYSFITVDPLIQGVLDSGAKPMITVPDLPLTWTEWQIATWLQVVAVHFAEQHDLTGWYWEILDEADRQEWEPLRPRWEVLDYVTMFNQAYTALKQVAPTVKVGGPGLSAYDDRYVEDLLHTVRSIDFISWHGEGARTVPRGNPLSMVNAAMHALGRDVDRAAALVARWKPGVQIVINSYSLNAWRPVTEEDDTRTVEADPRITDPSGPGAAWSIAALRQMILSPGGHAAALAVLQEATDGVAGPDPYPAPGTEFSYLPFDGRGLWPVDQPWQRTPSFFAHQLFEYYFPTGSQIVQGYSSDPLVVVLAAWTGDPSVNVAVINTSAQEATTQLALTGLPYYSGTWYTVDQLSFPPGFTTEQTSVSSTQTVTLEPYAVRILSVRNPFNTLRTPGLDVGGSVRGDKTVARDWVNHDGLLHPEIYAISTTSKYAGTPDEPSHSYASQAIMGGTSGGGMISQITPIDSVEPGNLYEISAYVRPRSLVSASGIGAYVRVEFLNQFAQPLTPPVVAESEHLMGTSDRFTKLEVLDGSGDPGVVAPAAANRMRVELVLGAEGGTAFFDQVYAGLADATVTPPSGGTITGTVQAWDQDFGPVAGARVSVEGQPYFTYTRADGTFEIDFVPEGTYDVTVTKDGYESSTWFDAEVFEREPAELSFFLLPTGGLLRITAVQSSEFMVEPDQSDIEVTMLVDNLASSDVRISEANLRFVLFEEEFEDVSGDYTVVPKAGNPTILRPHSTGNLFTFLVTVGSDAQEGDILIDGSISGYLNLVPNGSFEQESKPPIPPPGWMDFYVHAAIDSTTFYEGAHSHHHWYWKDENPMTSRLVSLNPIPVLGSSTYRIGFAYKDLQTQGMTDLYFEVGEYDETYNLVGLDGMSVPHSTAWRSREMRLRVQPDTRFLSLDIGMMPRPTSPPFPINPVYTDDFWTDDLYVELDSPLVDTSADIAGFWTVIGPEESLVLDPGWNLISLPADPVDPDPQVVFAGLPIEGALYRYDTVARGYVAYSAARPGDFGPCRAGEGYWLYVYEPASIHYQTAGTKNPQITVARSGWAMVGLPRTTSVPLANCLVNTSAGLLPMLQAAAAGWVGMPLYAYGGEAAGYQTVSPEGWASDDSLRPWVGYWLYANPPDGRLSILP